VDIQTFEKNVLLYEGLLYHVSWSMLSNQEDSADAVQEALTRAWQKRDTLRNEKAFKSWMVQILANVCRDMLRKRQKQRQVPLEEDMMADIAGDSGMYSVLEILEYITPEHRLVVVLHHLEGYRVREIAQMLKLPVGTVKSRLRSARACLLKARDFNAKLLGGIHYEEM